MRFAGKRGENVGCEELQEYHSKAIDRHEQELRALASVPSDIKDIKQTITEMTAMQKDIVKILTTINDYQQMKDSIARHEKEIQSINTERSIVKGLVAALWASVGAVFVKVFVK